MNEKKRGKRWYDENPELADHLDTLKEANNTERQSIFSGLRKLLETHAPDKVEKAKENPVEESRRWYDKDPEMSIVINSMQMVDPGIMGMVVGRLAQHFKNKKQ